VIAAITARFPPARILVAETYVQGPRAAAALADALLAICEAPEIDVVVLARGGGSFEDLLPFSDERLLRAIADCSVPIVSAVGHEQDMPLSDLVADTRASTPTAAARLVVPDLADLTARLDRSRTALSTGARRALDRERRRLDLSRDHLRRAPLLFLERRRAALEHSAGRLRALSPRATLDRGYAIVRTSGQVVRSSSEVTTGTQVDVELGAGGFGAKVEETR
jgi:exodeoxyribonuclease VII large subunit